MTCPWLLNCVCVCVLHGGETGREVKSKVSGHLRAFLSTYFLKNTYLWLTTLQLKKIAFCVCVPYEYVSVSTHTYVLTQSMLVEGVGVKREKTGGIQIALTGGRRDKGDICPYSGSHKWPLNRRLEQDLQTGARGTGGAYSLRGKFQSAIISLL